MTHGIVVRVIHARIKNWIRVVDSGTDQRRLAIVCGYLPAPNSVKAGNRHRLCIMTDYVTSKSDRLTSYKNTVCFSLPFSFGATSGES